MAAFWIDSRDSTPGAAPVWLGTPPAGVEVFAAGQTAILHDTRTADGYNRSAAIAEPTQNADVVVKFRRLRTAGSSWQLGGLGVTLRYVDSDNYVEVTCGSGSQQANGNIRERRVGNTADTLLSGLFAGGEFAWRYLRVNLNGATLRVRAWLAGDAEPATWHTSHTLVATPASGSCHLLYPYAFGGAVEIASIGIGTGANSAPTGPTRTIGGTVIDESGITVARKVRAYHRDTGAMVGEVTSSAATGAFSIPVERAGGYTLLCLDDDAGLVENDYAVRITV